MKDVVTHLLEFASGTFIIKAWLDSHPLKPIPPLKGSPFTPEVRVNSHKHTYHLLLQCTIVSFAIADPLWVLSVYWAVKDRRVP